MVNLKELQKISKDLKVLYVEDQEDIRLFTTSILKNFFKLVANEANGKDGLDRFNSEEFDLVITDIQMPKMTGIEMIREIRERDNLIPIVITTAFNDEKYLVDSISLGVDRYIIKPIEPKKLSDSLYAVATTINSRIKAKEYEEKLLEEKITIAKESVINKIANSFPVGCVVVTDGEIKFLNDSFKEILGRESYRDLIDREIEIDDIFDSEDGFLNSLLDIEESESGNFLIRKSGRDRMFRVSLKKVDLGDGKLSRVYAFSDITLLEYQRNKIKNFNELLQDVLFTKFKAKKAQKSDTVDVKSEQKQEDEVLAKVKEEFESKKTQDSNSVLMLDENEKSVLRRSHRHKVKAIDYIKEIGDSILDEILDLRDLDSDFADIIERDNLNFKELLSSISDILMRYSHTINSLVEFEDLAYAIESLSNLISNIDENLVDKKRDKIILILDGIRVDLKSWRESIFLNQNAVDIHYLDSSLFSSCVQIELEVTESDRVDDDSSDLELF